MDTQAYAECNTKRLWFKNLIKKVKIVNNQNPRCKYELSGLVIQILIYKKLKLNSTSKLHKAKEYVSIRHSSPPYLVDEKAGYLPQG